MDIYLVGGAVRDRLMQYPCDENDWVVVGATVEKMLQLGYKPVGKDFPIFLHPETQEEYALARTERKVGPGYHGFQFNTDRSVTLEEDLLRRDLTINAIAQTESGEIVDPFNGQRDLNNKILRHVSEHFAEDPVRILRVARFKARYHHLGFEIAAETMGLMSSMVAQGEVNHLVAERVWKEMSRALDERDPEQFIIVLRQCGALKIILPELDALYGVPQPPQHHPEIDCGIHNELVLQQACRLSDETKVRFAALMHDLGKALTPADVLPRHIGHEQKSAPLIKALCERLAIPNDFRDLAVVVAKYHTHCHRALELTAKKILETIEAADGLKQAEKFQQFLLCCEADARGRTGLENREYPQPSYLRQALTIAQGVTSKDVDASQFQGVQFGEELRRLRVNALQQFKQNYFSQQGK